MKSSLSVLLFALMTSVSPAALSADYQQILSCDGGAAVVDVNSSNRNNIQLVIRDANIVNYLYSLNLYDAGLVQRNCVTQGNTLRCDPPQEIILQGRNRIEKGSQQDPGNLAGYPYYLDVYESGDFSAVDAGVSLGGGPRLKFYRDGNGLKVAGYGYVAARCEGTISRSTGHCEGRVIPSYEYEIANWYFQDCR